MKKILIGSSFLALIIFGAVFAPWLATESPDKMSLSQRYEKPSWDHPFGLDENGSDVYTKVVYGARASLSVALCVVLISAFIGLLMGSLAGYVHGFMDRLIIALIDIFYAFPGFLLALGIMAVLEPSLKNIIIALSLTSWTGFARLIRGEVLYLKEREYVQSARALGVNDFRILHAHIWPNLASLLFIQMAMALAGVVMAESGLSFLGLGIPPTTPTWGALLNSGRKILFEAPHVSFFPGVAIFILVLGFNLLGEGLRDYLDPRKSENI